MNNKHRRQCRCAKWKWNECTDENFFSHFQLFLVLNQHLSSYWVHDIQDACGCFHRERFQRTKLFESQQWEIDTSGWSEPLSFAFERLFFFFPPKDCYNFDTRHYCIDSSTQNKAKIVTRFREAIQLVGQQNTGGKWSVCQWSEVTSVQIISVHSVIHSGYQVSKFELGQSIQRVDSVFKEQH